ncbi:MAG TPA: hypothetical protein VGK48_02535 [Terriglobia bacterium]|jgi:hypothetical protein
MTTVTKGVYHVKRLPAGATGANTINFYHPFSGGATHEIQETPSLGPHIQTENANLAPAIESEPSHPFKPGIEVAHEPQPVMKAEAAALEPVFGAAVAPSRELVPDLALHPSPDPLMSFRVPNETTLEMQHHIGPEKPRPPAVEEDVDAKAMAEAMREAARLGVPFCEKCARARLRAKEPPPDPVIDDVDPKLMAEAMREAARLGIPFCEKCARARILAQSHPADPASGDIDAGKIADAMRNAAREGLPFCEKCARAQLANNR